MYYRYVLKELGRRRQRMLVNCLGIAVGIGLFVSINATSAAYRDAVNLPFKNLGADLVVQRPEMRAVDSGQPAQSMRGIRLPISSRALAAGDLERLRAVDGVEALSGALFLWEFDRDGFRTIMGVDLTRPSLGPVRVKEWLVKGRFPAAAGEVVLEKHYANFHHLVPGGAAVISGRSFTVVGILEIKEGSQAAAANIYLSLADAQVLLGTGAGGVNTVYLRLKDPALLDRIRAEILRDLPGVSVASSDSFLEVMGGVSRISDQFALVVSLVALAGAVFLIIKAMLANLVERAREIGILKAVGWTGADVRRQVMGEVFVQALLGGVAGIAAGYLVSFLLGHFSVPVSTPWEVSLTPAFARDASAAAQTVRLPVRLSASLIAASLALSLAAGGLAGYFMARRTAKMKPADILRQL